MSYTNSTPNYHLPQYIGTDKPSWLADFNSSMLTIDTGITTAKAAGDGAQSSLSALSTQVNTNTNAIEQNVTHLNSIDDIVALINSKLSVDGDSANWNPTVNVTGSRDKVILTGYLIEMDMTGSLVLPLSYTIPTRADGSYVFVPLFSRAENIFNLTPVGSGATWVDSALYLVGTIWLWRNNGNDSRTTFVACSIAWTGSETIIGIANSAAYFSSLVSADFMIEKTMFRYYKNDPPFIPDAPSNTVVNVTSASDVNIENANNVVVN